MSLNNVIQEERGDCESDYLHHQSTVQQSNTTGGNPTPEIENEHASDESVTSLPSIVDDQSLQSSEYEIHEVTTSQSYSGWAMLQTTSQHSVGIPQTANTLRALPVYDVPPQNQDRDVNVDPNSARWHYTRATNSRPMSSTSQIQNSRPMSFTSEIQNSTPMSSTSETQNSRPMSFTSEIQNSRPMSSSEIQNSRHMSSSEIQNSRPMSSISEVPSPLEFQRGIQQPTTLSSSGTFVLGGTHMNRDTPSAQAYQSPNRDCMRHHQYWKRFDRLCSFNHWPAGHPVGKESLAQAGFFYLGYGDACRCYCCGLSRDNWETGDDAFVEHARWSPRCRYLREYKGEPFVEAVHQVLAPLNLVDTVERARHETIQHDPLPVGESQQQESGQDNPPQENPVQDQAEPVHQARIQLRDREYHPLPEALSCRICFHARVRVLILPCHHLVLCSECALWCQRCPVCRRPIEETRNVQLR